jgi:hypothetical protein
MTRRNRGLQHVRPERAANRDRVSQRRESTLNQHAIPQRAILIEQPDRLARGPDTRAQPRRLNLHQRDESVHFRLVRRPRGQHASETERILDERRPRPRPPVAA